MRIKTHKIRGIVLDRKFVGEHRMVVNILGLESGRRNIIMNRVNLPFAVEPLIEGIFVLYEGTNMHYLQDLEVVQYFANLKGDYDKVALGLEIASMISRYSVEEIPIPKVYWLFREFLGLLESQHVDIQKLKLLFKWLFVREMGYKPMLDRCVRCGRKVGGKNVVALSVENGGIICEGCRDGDRLKLLGLGEWKILAFILSSANVDTANRLRISDSVIRKLSLIVDEYIEFHMGGKGG
ncbi:MAG: DNA repair protein RecO [Synergistetes bacterium]|nr:DNA repair protein RecO [Synergistota bacterium]